MSIKTILTDLEPVKFQKETSQVINDSELAKSEVIEGKNAEGISKPYGLGTGDSSTIPIGHRRKYFDKSQTEFAINDIDTLRKELRSEWAQVDDFFQYVPGQDILNNVNTFQFKGLEHEFPIEISVEPLDFQSSPEDLFHRKERMLIKIPKNEFNSVFGTATSNVTFFDWFGDKISLGQQFSDTVFEMTVPMNKREVNDNNLSIKTSLAEFKGNYNYELPKYEEQIKNVDENLIQNIYALYSAIEYKDSSKNINLEGYVDHVTLGGEVDVILEDLVKTKKDIDFTNASYSLYLEAWSRAVRKLKLTPEGQTKLAELSSKFKHLVFPQSEKEIFRQVEQLRELFPMYVEMEFSTDSVSPMALALEEMKLSLGMMLFLIIDELGPVSSGKDFVEVQEVISESNKFSQSLSENTRESWDLVNFYKSYKALKAPSIILEAFEESLAFLGDGELEFKVAMTAENELYRKLLLTVFESKLRQFANNNVRTFKEILRGLTASSETLVYRIDKFHSDENGNLQEKLQTFWVPNTGDIDVVRFVDTQVKYDTAYVYKIYCYQLVYGTNYSYNAILENNDGLYETETDYVYQVTVESTPNLKLWEIPYYNIGPEENVDQPYEITRIIDDPPVFPDARFDAYIGVSNRVAISLNINVGEFELEPKFINTSDLSGINKIAIAQSRRILYDSSKEQFLDFFGQPQKLIYESDDSVNQFEVYRVTSKPTKYTDFSDSLRIILEPPISSFEDEITPNRKYWYVFRVKDSHGNYSNPTDVYEFKMVENSGIIYPELTVKTLEQLKNEVEPKMTSRSVQKYIEIKPSILQRFFSPQYDETIQSATDVNKPEIGVQELSVFDPNRKFKIRITSKQTGRKLDINLNFVHTHNTNTFIPKAGKK